MSEQLIKPNFLFEVSWEVCNKVGGIHTVVATKSVSLKNVLNDRLIMIGPDLVQDEDEHPEFEHDPSLFSEWVEKAHAEGLRIRIGRWKIPSKPVAILVDFSNFFSEKDFVFSKLWEDYKLDSISGQWDYIEPTLFGYAVGKVIESFSRHYANPEDKLVAQFHEWMTGSGLLYLKKNLPQVATAFTTHATVVGRSLAGNNRPLYNELEQFNAESIAKEFNITSKQSMEMISAREADVFTTVSEITARECKQFLHKEVDLVTPNGFEDTIVPQNEEFENKRLLARKKLLQTASCLCGEEMPRNSFIVATSGRYEFKNKGLDLFIDALDKINKEDTLDKPLIAYILIPANHYGPRKDLLQAINANKPCSCESKVLTHNLHDAEWDPILQRLNNSGLVNSPDQKVKVIFVPSYLNGDDGIFNLPYYDVLIGCDQTVFASYYEPWGYTPMESLAFYVPTVTTTLAGFGLWVKNGAKEEERSIGVIPRDDINDADVVLGIRNEILRVYKLHGKATDLVREHASKTSQTALWRSLVENYHKAYDLALSNALKRASEWVSIEERHGLPIHEKIIPLSNEPKWKRIIVKSTLPEPLRKINELLENIWWTWDDEAQELFKIIDPHTWERCDYTPTLLFEQVPYTRLIELSKDKDYIKKLERVHTRYLKYMAEETKLSRPRIAYFSMEFGFHDSLKLYSGGLGILAGDYLKEASDAKIDIVAISLLYRYGYFSQLITPQGEQQSQMDYQHFSKLPITPIRDDQGEFKTISLMFPGRTLHARIWLLKVGRLKMYLLDTDFEQNLPEDRGISHQLYGGSNENRLKQEMLLGIGGIRVLESLCVQPDLYHSNEGHSAFIGLERIRLLMKNNQLAFDEALEIVRATTLFTTHTPVPAGHDHFEEDLIRQYMSHYPERLRLSWEKFMALGRINPNDWSEKFNMSFLAAHLAQEVNGVSMLHGAVTREMFTRLWPGFLPEELHIGHVTNGVHWSTWTAPEWKAIYQQLFDNKFNDNQLTRETWAKIYDVSDKQVWDIKQKLRSKLIKSVKERFKENWILRHEDPKQIIAINNTLSDKALTIVFARRFATYKRAHLLFNNLDRLAKLVNNPEKPIQFLFAGKAHPKDKAGQDLIKMIVEISRRPEFLGKILFLQNYSIGMAKQLVSGADVWLNTPTRPLEASGTSGEKAVMNGTLHFSVLDGWWVEGYQPDAGWALSNERTYENQQYQDDLDAEIIYSLLENEIVPAFYERNKHNIPETWVSYIKNTIATVSPKFTTRRMIEDYKNLFYTPLYVHSQKLLDSDFEQAKQITNWKKHISRKWDDMEVLGIQMYERNTEIVNSGKKYKGQVYINLGEISHEHVAVEFVATEDFKNLITQEEFRLIDFKDGKAHYELNVTLNTPGTFQYGIRVSAKHPLLPHRQDFALVRWI